MLADLKLQELVGAWPSEARIALQHYFYLKLRLSKLNNYLEPKYRMVDALGEVRTQSSEWVRLQAPECFEAAEKQFHAEFPKCWDNAGQYAYIMRTDETRARVGESVWP